MFAVRCRRARCVLLYTIKNDQDHTCLIKSVKSVESVESVESIESIEGDNLYPG